MNFERKLRGNTRDIKGFVDVGSNQKIDKNSNVERRRSSQLVHVHVCLKRYIKGPGCLSLIEFLFAKKMLENFKI